VHVLPAAPELDRAGIIITLAVCHDHDLHAAFLTTESIAFLGRVLQNGPAGLGHFVGDWIDFGFHDSFLLGLAII
jgi:hypothetical protein